MQLDCRRTLSWFSRLDPLENISVLPCTGQSLFVAFLQNILAFNVVLDALCVGSLLSLARVILVVSNFRSLESLPNIVRIITIHNIHEHSYGVLMCDSCPWIARLAESS